MSLAATMPAVTARPADYYVWPITPAQEAARFEAMRPFFEQVYKSAFKEVLAGIAEGFGKGYETQKRYAAQPGYATNHAQRSEILEKLLVSEGAYRLMGGNPQATMLSATSAAASGGVTSMEASSVGGLVGYGAAFVGGMLLGKGSCRR